MKFGWIGVDCKCGAELKVNLEHDFGFTDKKTIVPASFFSFGCIKCDKVYNLKIDVWVG